MQGYGAKNMAASWRTVRGNTIQIAEEIPEEKYGFQVTPETMTVAQMLAHLAVATHWVEQAHFIERLPEITGEQFQGWFGEIGPMAASLSDKQAIIDALKARGDSFAGGLEAMTDAELDEVVTLPGGSKTRFEMLLGAKEHEMHHRAQLMQMERLLGIVPHLTRARQART